jgi:autotransporter-associated beta strand protein
LGNWTIGTVPISANTTDLHFAGTNNIGTALIPLNQNIATPFLLNNLFFDSGAGNFFLGGGDLAFTGNANTITQNSSGAQNIANNIVASTNSTVTLNLVGNNVAGVVTVSGTILAGNGNKDYAVTKTGGGTFTLSGANNYGGVTTISGGVLNIRNATALGSTLAGTTVATGAALQIQGGITIGAETLALNGSGIASDGAFRNISGNNGFGGAITLGSASTISSDSGTLTLSGAINNGGFLLTEMGAGNVTISSVISGTGGLTKTGAGTLTLSGATSNTYAGPTTVNQGTLILAKPGSVLAPAINIGGAGSSATVQLNAAYQLYGAATAINSLGQLNLNNFNEYVGTLTLSGASITTGTGLLYLGGTITSNANAVSSTMAGNYVLYGNQTFNIASGTTPSGIDLVISGPISEFAAGTTVTKTGAGEFVFSGANTYSGTTTISAGVLNIQHASALGTTAAGTTVASGAALQIQGGINVGNEALALNGSGIGNTGAFRNISGTNSFGGTITLASASTIYSDAGTLTLSGGIVNGGFTATFGGPSNIVESGLISGTGALVKNGPGTLTLSGANTYSGGSTINGGTVIVFGGSLGASSGTATLNAGTIDVAATVSSTRSFILGDIASTITVDPTLTFTTTGIFSGIGALNKTGTGTMVLGGTNTYTGNTAISAGILQVNTNNALGTVAGGTTVSSGAALKLNAVNYTTAEGLTLNGSGISNGGALTNSGTSTFAGAINIATNATISAGGGTLNLTGGVAKNGTILTIAGGGTVNITTNGITGGSPNSDLVIDGTTVVLNAANSYNGPTTIQNTGTLRLGNSNVLPTSPRTPLTVNTSSIFDLASHSDAVASLSGDSTAIVKNSTVSTTSTLTINPGSGVSTTFAGVIAGTNGGTQGNVTLQKDGTGALTLTGVNTYSGATTINGGTLTAGSASGNALGSTSSITVNSGGTLLLSTANNQINDAATMTLNGGTFNRGTVSEGDANTIGVGALTLTASSHIDFGTGAVGVLTFASFAPSAFSLIIDNWTGTIAQQGGGSADRLIFDSNQSLNLSSFNFTGYAGAVEFDLGNGFYEVVPAAVPEPATYISGFLAFAAVLFHHRKQLRTLFRRRIATK